MKEIFASTKTKMAKSLESLEHNMSVLRTGRAHPNLLSKIVVDYYGTETSLTSLASINASDARTLMVTPFDKGALPNIEKAIRDSELGLNPNNKGDAIIINIPALTEERRKELVKAAKGYTEEAKVAVRNVRQDSMKSLKQMEKDKTASSDEVKRGEAEIQKITDDFVKQVDALFERKEQDILSQ